uniref:Multiple myeloma tumor-associated protein 2-like N-terminal domain-containing protein n=1 Tax=Aegilops tauschii subsp. strangulata TaxID=200361 RepID=A0A453RRT9_AEGTS
SSSWNPRILLIPPSPSVALIVVEMYHPTRGGVRGGRDQFKWDDVKVDKHRENYLGHSVKAPVGRWQKGK